MNDNAMLYDYMMQMGSMTPEMEQMKRQQAQVDALRGAKMGAGSTVGSGAYQHYVPKGIAGAIGALGQNALGAYGQSKVDASNKSMNAKQAQGLEELRKRWGLGGGSGYAAAVDTTNPAAFMADFSDR